MSFILKINLLQWVSAAAGGKLAVSLISAVHIGGIKLRSRQ